VLDEGADSSAVVRSHHEITFPMPEHGTVGDLGRSFGGHHLVADAAACLEPAARAPLSAAAAQTASEFPAQLSAPLHEERLVDRLVAHLHEWIVREGDSPLRNLFGATTMLPATSSPGQPRMHGWRVFEQSRFLRTNSVRPSLKP
jgi:hypothetical protein